MIIALVAQNHWKIHQMDVKSAFFNGFLDEEVNVEQRWGYEKKEHENQCLQAEESII